jgi:hypothetical protein
MNFGLFYFVVVEKRFAKAGMGPVAGERIHPSPRASRLAPETL